MAFSSYSNAKLDEAEQNVKDFMERFLSPMDDGYGGSIWINGVFVLNDHTDTKDKMACRNIHIRCALNDMSNMLVGPNNKSGCGIFFGDELVISFRSKTCQVEQNQIHCPTLIEEIEIENSVVKISSADNKITSIEFSSNDRKLHCR
jgi:hypothetical protein